MFYVYLEVLPLKDHKISERGHKIYNNIEINFDNIMEVYKKHNDFEIIKNSSSENWNQYNIEKLSPFHLLMNLDFDVYHELVEKLNIKISKSILEDIKKNIELFFIKIG